LLVFGPGDPPVPFTIPLPEIEPAPVLPELPAEAPPVPPDPPPPAWASTDVLVNASAVAKTIAVSFISISVRCQSPVRHPMSPDNNAIGHVTSDRRKKPFQ
jgi:hypothetical protein